jgi:hypothetical protein
MLQVDAWGQLLTLLFYFAVMGLIILCIVGLLKPKRMKPLPEPAVREREPAPPKETKAFEPEPIRERIITERVLVVCPYCGAKTEQGLLKCQNCRADL